MAKKELMAAVKAYYESQGWHFKVDEEKDRIEMAMGLRSFSCRVLTRVYDNRFTTYCFFPVRVPEKQRAQAGEYLHRANYGLNIGNFEFDYNDGEVRYKAHMRCGDQVPDQKVIERLVDVGMDMTIRYGDGLMKVIYGGVEPKKAIHDIEHDEEEASSDAEIEALLKHLRDEAAASGEESKPVLPLPETGEEAAESAEAESGGEETDPEGLREALDELLGRKASELAQPGESDDEEVVDPEELSRALDELLRGKAGGLLASLMEDEDDEAEDGEPEAEEE